MSMLIEHLGLTRNGFAQRIGLSSTVINGIVKGSHKPGNKVLDAIKQQYPKVSTDWLLGGSGDMLNDDATNQSFGVEVAERLETELKSLREIFARQLEVKDQQIDRLSRMLEGALGKPDDVAARRSVLHVHPSTLSMLEGVGARA